MKSRAIIVLKDRTGKIGEDDIYNFWNFLNFKFEARFN